MRSLSRVLSALPFLLAAASFAAGASLTAMLDAAGIKDRGLLNDALNRKLTRLSTQMENAKTPAVASRAQQELRQAIQGAAGVYKSFQRCRQAADVDPQGAAQSAVCSQERRDSMKGVIADAGLDQLNSDLGVSGGGACNQDQELACQYACDRNPACNCCLGG